MTNLSKATRALLEEHFTINHIAVDQQQRSTDGTIKNAVQLFDGRIVESVLIPVKDRTTACVSSQVGCGLDCLFYCYRQACPNAQPQSRRDFRSSRLAIDQQSKAYFDRPLPTSFLWVWANLLMRYNNVLSAIEK